MYDSLARGIRAGLKDTSNDLNQHYCRQITCLVQLLWDNQNSCVLDPRQNKFFLKQVKDRFSWIASREALYKRAWSVLSFLLPFRGKF